MTSSIVGGGIAGLAAAYELHRAAASRSSLLERGARAGGVILSEEVDGFTIDARPGRAAGPEAGRHQALRGARSRRSAGADQAAAPRLHPARRRLHPLPAASVLGIPTRLGPFVRTRLFSLAGQGCAWAPSCSSRRGGTTRDESIGAFMTRRFGAEATTYLAEPLLAGIHAGDVDRLSVRALFPRFVEAERHARQPAARVPRASPARRAGRRRVPVAAGRPERDGRALVAALAAATVRLDTPVRRVIAGRRPRLLRVETGDRRRR